MSSTPTRARGARPNRCARPLVVAAALLAAATGCGDKAVMLYPVHGQVKFRGNPAAGALVVFHDVRPADQLKDIPIPRATAQADGTFRLTCFGAREGAPAGKYRITIVLPEAVLPAEPTTEASDGDSAPSGAVVDPESAPSPRDLLKARYADPATSGLEATVVEGDNNLPAFDLE